MKQIEVRIMGQNYLLGCAEGAEQELLDAVQIVDREMCEIRDGGKLRARERIAVLAALNLAVMMSKKNTGTHQSYKQPESSNNNLNNTQISLSQIEADCKNLIYKIDEVLGSDGQLL